MYTNFLGKALPSDRAKFAVADAWKGFGGFTMNDTPMDSTSYNAIDRDVKVVPL